MPAIETRTPSVPAHVPPELVWEHDLDAFTHELDDPYLSSSRLHEGPEIIWATNAFMGHPAWVLTRHALIEEAFIDHEHFSTGRSPSVERVLGESWRLIPLEIDPLTTMPIGKYSFRVLRLARLGALKKVSENYAYRLFLNSKMQDHVTLSVNSQRYFRTRFFYR